MEHVSDTMDIPVSEMQMRIDMPNYHQSQFFSVSKDRMGFLEPGNAGFRTLMEAINTAGYDPSSEQLGHQDLVLLNNVTGQKTSLPAKRKAEMEHMSNDSVSQPVQMPNKHIGHLGANIALVGLQQSSASQRRTGPAQPNLSSPGLQMQYPPIKKMFKSDSVSGKPSLQSAQPAKKPITQSGLASKSRPESSEAVRSKMRESLAAALALAYQKPSDASNTDKDQIEHTVTPRMSVDSQASEPSATLVAQVLPSELPLNQINLDSGHAFPDLQFSSIVPEREVQFSDNLFCKDDLLQGNGLSWAFDFDMQMRVGKDVQIADKPQPMKDETNSNCHALEVAILTPENLAFKIETELFRLFGGINKKYKEKGRSLLFNLKDQKNPQLRERVLSSEISPERLCSMSTEELASKELSEWRMAKAEELAQMVVLPDTEVDVRRLVKKTHKGEYQVEFEHDGGVIDEVSGGNSMISRPQLKKDTENHSPPKAIHKDEENVSGLEKTLEDQDFSGSLIIPTDGTDLMQGMMVDELKDGAFLPPIVSLDEFMESLTSAPPFENLSADAVQKAPLSHEGSPKVVSNSQAASDITLNSPINTSSRKADFVLKHEANVKSSSSDLKTLPTSLLGIESIWEGILQLNVSSSITVRGLFQSGEKTSAKAWSPSLEIKGRVRLDAFEKFLQELPMSRTRAVMVLDFILKDQSSESQLSDLSEAVHSYSADERLGYAEPVAGVEVYLCPPTPRISELLKKHLSKLHPETNNSVHNGLIGVVVWRRVHISNSTNSSSKDELSSKKQPFSPPNRFQDSSHVNVARTPHPVLNNVTHSKPDPEPEEDDDVPPGFGPARDDDDLPEFNFSGGLNPSVPRISSQNLSHDVKMNASSHPIDHVRELIQKYGQIGTNAISRGTVDNRDLGIEPWNDDEDDIPEWRPQATQQLHHQPFAVVHGYRPPAHLSLTNKLMAPSSPRGIGYIAPRGGWVQPDGHRARWTQH